MSFAMLICTLLTWWVAGRLLTTHLGARHSTLTWVTPLGTGVAGMAMGWLWLLVFVPLLGMHPLIAAGLGAFCVLMLSGGMFHTWRGQRAESHTAPLILFTAAFAAPLLFLTQPLTFGTAADFHLLHLLTQLPTWPAWPTAAQVAGAGLPPLTSVSIGWLLTWLPAGIPTPPTISVFNALCILLSLTALPAATGVPLRWSNLFLVAAGLALMAIVTMPTVATFAATPQPVLLAMACVLAVAIPLVQPTPLPHGLPMLLPALANTALAMAHPAGLTLAMLLAGFYVLRTCIQGLPSAATASRALFGVAAMVCLPLLAHMGHQLALAQLQQPLTAWLIPPSAWQLPSPLTLLAAAAGLAALITQPWPNTFTQRLQAIFTSHAILTLPLMLAMISLFIPALSTLCLWLWLLPLQQLWQRSYRHSGLQRWAFASPWSLGLLVALTALGLGSILGPMLRPAPSPTLPSAWLTTLPNHLPANAPIATLGLTPAQTAQAASALTTHIVQPFQANQPTTNLSQLHQQLRAQGFGSLITGVGQGAHGLTSTQLAHVLQVTPPVPQFMAFHTMPQGLALTAATGLQAQPLQP